MKILNFKGLMSPVFTGFSQSNQLNVNIIPEYAKFLASNNIKGILVNGTTGEGVSMTSSERKTNLEAWMKEKSKYNFSVMVQIGGTNYLDVIELVKHAENLKVDSLLCLPELFFYPKSNDELINYLQDVAAAAPNTPFFYYHIPMYTRLNFDMEEFMIKCLERIDTFGGIKFTHTNLEEFYRATQVNTSLTCFLGCDQYTLAGYLYECHSQIAAMINIYPKQIQEILKNIQEKNVDKAQTLQHKFNKNISTIDNHGSWLSSMKCAMKYASGIDFGNVRKPNKFLTTDDQNQIKNLFMK